MLSSTEASGTNSSCDDILKKYDNTLPLTERQLVKYLRKVLNSLFTRITKDNWEKHKEVAVNYADLKASIDENIAHKDHTDKLVEASMSSLDKRNNTISDLYKGSVTLTLALTHIPANVKGKVILTLALKILCLTLRGRLMQANKKILRDLSIQLMPTLSLLAHPNLNPQSLKHNQSPSSILNYSSHKEKAKAHMDKEEKIKKAEEEARLFVISKPKVIKVVMEALVSYLVAVYMVQSPDNARFSMKLKKLIAEHPNQEKLKSKKVKLEAFAELVEPGFELIDSKMGRNGCFSFVRLGSRSRGFKTLFLGFTSALKTFWDFLDQRLDSIND
nr:hypothetical protein [Tanacetum cinerariifolium]